MCGGIDVETMKYIWTGYLVALLPVQNGILFRLFRRMEAEGTPPRPRAKYFFI